MNSIRLWNSHQRHKFFEGFLKIRVLEMVFPGISKRYFPLRTPCCFIRIHARLRTMLSKCPRCSMTSHSSIHGSKPVIQNWETDALQFYSMALIFC